MSRTNRSRLRSGCYSLAAPMPRARWFKSESAIHALELAERNATVPERSEADEHRFSWGWMRLALGLTQMSFSLTAGCVLVFRGLGWRVYTAAAVATLAAAASRLLYAGRPDPVLEPSVRSGSAGQAKVTDSVRRQGDGRNL